MLRFSHHLLHLGDAFVTHNVIIALDIGPILCYKISEFSPVVLIHLPQIFTSARKGVFHPD